MNLFFVLALVSLSQAQATQKVRCSQWTGGPFPAELSESLHLEYPAQAARYASVMVPSLTHEQMHQVIDSKQKLTPKQIAQALMYLQQPIRDTEITLAAFREGSVEAMELHTELLPVLLTVNSLRASYGSSKAFAKKLNALLRAKAEGRPRWIALLNEMSKGKIGRRDTLHANNFNTFFKLNGGVMPR